MDGVIWTPSAPVPSLTLGGLHHLSVHGGGDERLGQVLQIAVHPVTEPGQIQLVQLLCGLICSNTHTHTHIDLVQRPPGGRCFPGSPGGGPLSSDREQPVWPELDFSLKHARLCNVGHLVLGIDCLVQVNGTRGEGGG